MFGGMELKDIPARLRVMNRSQADLARHLDLDPSSLTKTIKGLRNVQAAELTKLEAYFGEAISLPDGSVRLVPNRRAGASDRVPVYGYGYDAPGVSEDRIDFRDDRVLETREPAPYWSGAGELIYARNIGEAMAPRYFDGEVVAFRRGVPAAKGDDCLVEYTDGSATIRVFDGRSGSTVLLSRYNPPGQEKVDATKIRALHTAWRPARV